MGRPKKSVSLDQSVLNSAKLDDSSILVTGEERTPDRTSPRWSEYVLSHLEADEYVINKQDPSKKFPKTDCLPRLIEKFIGPILQNNSHIAVAPVEGNNQKVMVEHTLVVQDDVYSIVRQVVSIGEASELKLVPPFNLYSGPISSTRAMGRSYKTMLHLKNVLTAEETSCSVDEKDESLITPPQIKGIEMLTARLGIDMNKYLHSKYGAFSDIRELTKEFGSSVMTDLNKMRDGSLEIPEECKL